MRTMPRIVLLLLFCTVGVAGLQAQDRTESPRRQEKEKEKEKKRTEQGDQQESVRRVSVPPIREIAPRLSKGTGRDVPAPERSSESSGTVQRPGAVRSAEIRSLLNSVEDGFTSGSIGRFSPYFASQVGLTLRGGETGSYSANQAYYVLENYLRSRKLVDFELQSISDFDVNPFATGTVSFAARGGRETAQVYVALTSAGGHWVITQINIY